MFLNPRGGSRARQQRLIDDLVNEKRTNIASGSRLTFESREGFRAGSRRASLRHAIWYFPFRHVGGP